MLLAPRYRPARAAAVAVTAALWLSACSGGGSGSSPADTATGGSTGSTTSSGSGGAGGSSGSSGGTSSGGGSSAPTAPFAVPNPYARAGASSADDVRVSRAVVFGDSYSAPRTSYRNWSAQLVADGTFAREANFAVSGSVARGSGTRSLAGQIDRWRAGGAPFRSGDLTLVYFGHNDVKGTENERTESKTALSGHLDTLQSSGATAADRRLFLMLIHDWSRNPDNGGVTRQTVLDWNSTLASEANRRARVVAVDVFTLFERIFADPGKFGFTNVTSPDPANSETTALYRDSSHFGSAGHSWIARLVRHYLTRGWDWANTVDAGAQAAARLRQDIDSGVLQALTQLAADQRAGGFLFQIGEDAAAFSSADAPIARLSEDGQARGLGAGWRLADGSALVFAFARDRSSTGSEDQDERNEADTDSSAWAVEWHSRTGPLTTRSHFQWTGQDQERTVVDRAFGSFGRAQTRGEVWSIGQTMALPLGRDGFGVTPWLDLAYERQTVDGYTMPDPYLGSVSFGDAAAGTVMVTTGIDVGLAQGSLPAMGPVELRGSVLHTRSLAREDFEVAIREGVTRRQETISRGEIARSELRLAAELARPGGQHLSLSAQGAVDDDTGPEVGLFFTWRYPIPAAR